MRAKWSSTVADVCQGVSVGLGLLLVVVWMSGVAVGGRGSWLYTIDAAAACVAFVAAGAFRTPEIVGVALWGVLGIVLLSVGLFALSVGARPGWSVWAQILIGVSFLGLVVSAAATFGPRRPRALA
jgi:hypothetical protein